MSVTLQAQIQNNENLRGVLSIDPNNQITILDQTRALQILARSDANSVEYRLVQIGMHISNVQVQNDLRTRLDAGEVEIRRLELENTRVSDDLTSRQMREDQAQMNTAEKLAGVADLLLTLPKAVVVPPMILIGPFQGLCKLIVPGSEAWRQREGAMVIYQHFHPDAPLTEAYSYVKEHPLKFDATLFDAWRDRFFSDNPTGNYDQFVEYGNNKIPAPKSLVVEFTGKGPTGFQMVSQCDCADCSIR